MEWISVDDRLPEEHEDILIYYNPHSPTFPQVRYMTQSSYYNSQFEVLDSKHEVTHWGELPEPPQET